MSTSRNRAMCECQSIIFFDSSKYSNSILAGCLQLKFLKVFIQTFIYKIDSAIKVRGHGHQLLGNY